MANISFIMDRFPGGGVERVTMNLTRPLTELGHRVFLFVNELRPEKLPEEQLSITYIELPHKVNREENYGIILDAIKRYNIQIFFMPGMFPRYIKALRATGLCKIVNVLHSMPFNEVVYKRGEITRPPQKESIGSWLKRNILSKPKLKLGYYDRKMLKRYKDIYNDSDIYGVLFDSYGEQLAKKMGIDYDSSNIRTLQNPIPAVDFNAEECKREKRLVYVGRLSYWDKRLDRLLAVWEKLHLKFTDWRLTFVGDGEEERNLRDIVAKKGLERVEFLGWQNRPFEYFLTSEIMCMTSIVEGCPMALLEAQQCGCATIAFNCCNGVSEIISKNWENGVYVPDGNIDSYAEALSKLMSNDELRHKIQGNGPINAKRFSVEASVKQYDKLINELCTK